MKKIICLTLTAVMILAMLSITAMAAEEPIVSYKVNWSELSYEAYGYDQLKYDMDTYYSVTKDENLLSFDAITGSKLRAYVATERFEISNDTKYEYVFQTKNNNDYGYSGAVFAFANGLPYFVYGGFNNKSDSAHSGQSCIDIRKGLHKHSTNDCETGFEKSYLTLALDSDGYVTLKVVYDGYQVTLYGLTDSANNEYEAIGNTITLPSDAKVAMGAFNRETDTSSGLERTASVRNAIVYGMNNAAVQNMPSVVDDNTEFILYVESVEKEYLESDYESESYADFLSALDRAKALIEEENFDELEIAEARASIEEAIDMLELMEPDFSEIDEWIAKAYELDEAECDADAYEMLMSAVDEANLLLDKVEIKQSELDAAVALIFERYKEIVPDAVLDTELPDDDKDEEDGENVGDENVGDENANDVVGDATGNTVGDETQTGSSSAEASGKGCKSALASSSALALLALVGTAVVVSKEKQ